MAITAPSTVGWWAETHERFGLVVSPSLGADTQVVAGDADFALAVQPDLSVLGVGSSREAFGLSVSPSLELDGSSRSRGFMDVAVSPSVGMAGREHFDRILDLSVNPALGVAGTESFRQIVDLSVSPSLSVDGVGRHGGQFGVAVNPELGMDSAPHSSGDFGLSVSPSLDLSAKTHHDSTFDLSVSPSLGVGADMRAKSAFTVAPVPLIGMAGEGIEPPSEVAFDNSSSSPLGTSPGTFQWSHTNNGAALVVAVSIYGSGTQTASVTYGGIAMTLLENRLASSTELLLLFGLIGPPTGANHVAVTWSVTPFIQSAQAMAASYAGVGSFGSTYSNSGTGTSLSQTVSSIPDGHMVAHAFRGGRVISGYNATTRVPAFGGNENWLILGDRAGPSTSNFTATQDLASSDWASTAVELIPG